MPWIPDSVATEDWGRLLITVGNFDATFFRGVPTQVGEWSSTEPFGDSVLTLTFPQITTFEPLPMTVTAESGNNIPTASSVPVGHLAWLAPGRHAEVFLLRPNGSRLRLWSGIVASYEDQLSGDNYALGVHCLGALYQADLSIKPPGFSSEPRDIGTVIAETLNGYASRDYRATSAVATGILTRKRGGWEPRLTGFVQDLLSTATTADGKGQWTVAQRDGWTPVIKLKDRTTIHATLTCGQPGVDVSLSVDLAGTPNVIFGEGVDSEGCHWRNTKYPNLRTDDAPVYPHSPSSTFGPGDGMGGFDEFADEMRTRGYSMASGDTYVSADVAEVRDVQARAGITVDGIVGPQTWAAVFQTGSNGGDLSGTYFAPLAFDPAVEPNLYNAAGAVIGKNPTHLLERLRVERFENFGEGVTKVEGMASARAEYLRDAGGGWNGTLTLKIDPPERSRFELRAGMNVRLREHRGMHRSLHISAVSVNWQDGSVSLTVDEKARDLVTLAGLKSRNKEAAQDPARRNSTLRRRSRDTQDSIVVFDCESGAGRIPRHAVFGGLWTVLRIPAGQIGTIVKTEYSADANTAFSVGVFGMPITSNALARMVGNPLAEEQKKRYRTLSKLSAKERAKLEAADWTVEGDRLVSPTPASSPWSSDSDDLLDAGLLVAWGQFDQPMGYYPAAKSDEGNPKPTGLFRDESSWQYETTLPPWLWVAEYSPVSTFLRGRLFAGVES